MSDTRLRDRQRQAEATGTVEDHAALLRERMRVGDLDADGLALAAFLGHKPSRLVVLGHDESERRPRHTDTRAEPVGWLTTHAIRDSQLPGFGWPAWIGTHPMPYVPKLAGVLIARGTWQELIRRFRANPPAPGVGPLWLELGHLGRVMASMAAWAECPCEPCRRRVGEGIQTHSQHDPENWWRSAAAAVAGYCAERWAIEQVASRCANILTPHYGPFSHLPVQDRRLRWNRADREAAARATAESRALVRSFLAPMIPWALRGSDEPAVFRPVPT